MSYPDFNYIGSKQTMIDWIWKYLTKIPFNTVLDLFGGSGIISHYFLKKGKNVYYNDIMKHLLVINKGLLLGTKNNLIDLDEIRWLWEQEPGNNLHKARTYYHRYFFEDELDVIDRFIQNYHQSDYDEITKGLHLFVLTQSCLKKRPFANYQNSFLKLRQKPRESKQTWDNSMESLFLQSIDQVNSFLSTKKENETMINFGNYSSFAINTNFIKKSNIDLVYIDPPFVARSKKSRQLGNYANNYHFNEFLVDYYKIEEEIAMDTELKKPRNDSWQIQQNKKWLQPEFFEKSLEELLKNTSNAELAYSYRDDSMFSIELMKEIIERYYDKVEIFSTPHIYKNRKKDAKYNDILILAS